MIKDLQDIREHMEKIHSGKDKKETFRFNLNLWLPILVTILFSTLAILQQYNNTSIEKLLNKQLQELQQISSRIDSAYKLLYQMQLQRDTIGKK